MVANYGQLIERWDQDRLEEEASKFIEFAVTKSSRLLLKIGTRARIFYAKKIRRELFPLLEVHDAKG